jgi:hypothetical protein
MHAAAISPLPQYAFMAWCSVKAQGHLYLYLLLAIVYYDLGLHADDKT